MTVLVVILANRGNWNAPKKRTKKRTKNAGLLLMTVLVVILANRGNWNALKNAPRGGEQNTHKENIQRTQDPPPTKAILPILPIEKVSTWDVLRIDRHHVTR